MALRKSACFFGIPLILLIGTCTLLDLSHAIPSNWLFKSPFESANCNNTVPLTTKVSRMQCARHCGWKNECVGFFHNVDMSLCLIIDPTASSDCTLYDLHQPLWKSWEKTSGQSITGTTRTITTEQSTAPISTTEEQPTIPISSTEEQTNTPFSTTEKHTTPISTTEDYYFIPYLNTSTEDEQLTTSGDEQLTSTDE